MKKTTMKKSVILALVLVLVMTLTVVLSACHKDTPAKEGPFTEFTDYVDTIKAELGVAKSNLGDLSDYATVNANVNTAYNNGLEAIDAATDVSGVLAAYKSAVNNMASQIPYANGMYDFTALSTEEKTDILGLLEAFSIRNGMLGVSLYENGNYQLIKSRVVLGTENFISGYGFGTLAEGNITADMANESNAAWKRYYHTVNAQDPGTANYLNDNGSEVSDFYSYISASYFTNFMNATKDGYDWVPELAKADPTPVGGLDQNGQAATWEFPIHTDLKYSTLGKHSEYNGRQIQPEDYITPFKLLLNAQNNYFRGTEMSNQTGVSSIVGAKEYYASTKAEGTAKGILPTNSTYDFSKVGVKVYEKEEGSGNWYFQYTLGQKTTPFYARYYISSSLYMPIPADFITLVGADNYLGYNADKTDTPVDNSLSLGAYILERWDSNQQVVYKKNTNYVYSDTKYAIQGVHINILPAMTTNTEAVFNEYMAGNVDACGIPQTKLQEYKDSSEAHKTLGDSAVKLNMNALNPEDWLRFFGENGEINPNAPSDYWTVKPVLSNSHFRSALSYALNRDELAALKGFIGSVNYFSSDYMSDPVNGISYNATDQHAAAVAPLLANTVNGYNLELARENFRLAMDELESQGYYKRGTLEHPTVISIQISWQAASQEESMHKYIKQYWETAFNNDPKIAERGYKLEVNFWAPNVWSEVYDLMTAGKYDIGLGSINGNTLDPLNYFSINSVVPSISANFTLNWAIDTRTPDAAPLVYNGVRWSFDALYKSTQQPTVVTDGVMTDAATYVSSETKFNEDESVDLTIKFQVLESLVFYPNEFDYLINGYYGAKQKYGEISLIDEGIVPEVSFDEATHTYTVVLRGITKEIYSQFDVQLNGVDLLATYSNQEGNIKGEQIFIDTFEIDLPAAE